MGGSSPGPGSRDEVEESSRALSVRVRPASLEDAAVVQKFNQALAEESEGRSLDPDRLREGVMAQIQDPARGRYYLASLDAGEILGQLAVTWEWSDWRNGFFWWLQSVYVRPGFRRRGVFRALFRAVEAEARRDPDCCGLRLYVEGDNKAALKTYRALGLEDASYRMMERDFRAPQRSP